jgi:hypothetical protein
MDPESGLDAVRSVGITGNKIAAVSSNPLRGKIEVDANNLLPVPALPGRKHALSYRRLRPLRHLFFIASKGSQRIFNLKEVLQDGAQMHRCIETDQRVAYVRVNHIQNLVVQVRPESLR